MATEDSAVAAALDLLSAPPTWVSLYNVYEVVEKDGGAGLAPAGDLETIRSHGEQLPRDLLAGEARASGMGAPELAHVLFGARTL
jgi:hypothetical protein